MTSRELVKQTIEFRNTSERVPRELWTLPWADNNFHEELAEIQHSFPNDIAKPENVRAVFDEWNQVRPQHICHL